MSVLCFIYNLIDNISNFWTEYFYEFTLVSPFYLTCSLLYETVCRTQLCTCTAVWSFHLWINLIMCGGGSSLYPTHHWIWEAAAESCPVTSYDPSYDYRGITRHRTRSCCVYVLDNNSTKTLDDVAGKVVSKKGQSWFFSSCNVVWFWGQKHPTVKIKESLKLLGTKQGLSTEISLEPLCDHPGVASGIARGSPYSRHTHTLDWKLKQNNKALWNCNGHEEKSSGGL